MSASVEMIVVGVVVLGAVIWAGRAIWKHVHSKKVCSSCGSDGDCPLTNPEDCGSTSIPLKKIDS